MTRHIPRRRWTTVTGGDVFEPVRDLYPPRMVLVPGTRRAIPFHPLSIAAAEYRRSGSTDTPAVVLNARRRARKARR